MFGPAEAALPAEKQGPRFHDPRRTRATLLIAAGEIGLAAIIGAFLAGMVVAETKERTEVEEAVEPLYAFFAPFFFA